MHSVDIGYTITSLCSGWVQAQNPLGEGREKIMVWLKNTCLTVSITSAQVVMYCWLVGLSAGLLKKHKMDIQEKDIKDIL